MNYGANDDKQSQDLMMADLGDDDSDEEEYKEENLNDCLNQLK